MDIKKAENAFDTTVKILKNHMSDFEGGFPADASENDIYPNKKEFGWTEGFYTGMLWLAYERTQDDVFKNLAQEHVERFYKLVTEKGIDHHDAGFLYSLSCVASYKLTGNELAKEAAILAAEQLIARFHEKGEFIQAWGPLDKPESYRFIIDCLLNIPLLYWATETTGNKKYAEIATKHLKTAQRLVIRDNYSTHHTYFMNPETGEPDHGETFQGYSDDSAWARGQAWGIYGLILNFIYTQDESLIKDWKGVTDYFLNNLPEDLVAYWDLWFTDGDEPRDSSASAIAVCGILECVKQGKCDENYLKKAYDILDSLIDNYATKNDGTSNGLLRHSTYVKKQNRGVDECCIWGDYFYMEALMRVINPAWKLYW